MDVMDCVVQGCQSVMVVIAVVLSITSLEMSVSCLVWFEESKYIIPEAFTPVASLRDYADGGLWKDELTTRN
jgi:hypothetical protein